MIYAVNTRTKKHQVVKNPEMAPPGTEVDCKFSDDKWIMVEADGDGWIEWKESVVNPLPGGAKCDVILWGRKLVPCVVAHGNASWEGVTHYRPILSDESDPEAPAWDGKGELPPIGFQCLKGNTRVMILAHANVGSPYDPAVVWQSLDDPGDIDWAVANVFAPIRTAEYKAVEAMAWLLADEFDATANDCTDAARALYRAGLRFTEEAS